MNLIAIAVFASVLAMVCAGGEYDRGLISYGHEIPTTSAFTYESRTLHPVPAPLAARGLALRNDAYGWGPAGYAGAYGPGLGYGGWAGDAFRAYGGAYGGVYGDAYNGAYGGHAPLLGRAGLGLSGLTSYGLHGGYLGAYGKLIK